MNFLIQIDNGVPINNPVSEENLRIFIPNLDINNPPAGWARFVRTPMPEIPDGEVLDKITYKLSYTLSDYYGTPTYTDEYHFVPISDEKIIEQTKEFVRNYNETMKRVMGAPYSAPDDGNFYVWSRHSNSWIKKPKNLEKILDQFYAKLKEFGLENASPEEIENLQGEKRIELESIVDEIQ